MGSQGHTSISNSPTPITADHCHFSQSAQTQQIESKNKKGIVLIQGYAKVTH